MTGPIHMKVNRRPKRRRHPEEDLQRAVAQYLDLALPSDAVWWHTPNGGVRTKAEAGILKAMGVKAGIPDIFVLWQGRLYGIELKADDGKKPTPAQFDMACSLATAGASPTFATSLQEVWAFLQQQGVPLGAMPT